MITIYDISGVERLSVLETEPAVYYRMLMGKHHVFLSFRTTEYVPINTGDYIDFEGKRFTLYTPQKPKEISEEEYLYELYFGAPEMSFLNFVLFYAGDSKWVLTSNAATFMQVVLENIIRYTGDSGWTLGTVIPSETKTIQFDGENGFDALTLIAETFESEWYVEDKVLYLTKCEFGTEVELKQGDAINEKEASESSDEYITRLYAFGSTRNIPEDYRTTETVGGKVEKRLKLPAGTPYIDAWPNMQPHEVVEGVRIFEEIYPRQVCTVTEVRTETRTVEEVEITVYILKYSGLTFSEDYLITDPLSLVFQSGNLNGRDFELVFLPDTNEFEIINETDGVTLPNADLAPVVGDLFVLYNFNIQLVSDQYVTNAELELQAEASTWLSYKSMDVSVYTCPTNPVYCETNGIDLAVGQKVSLVGQMFPNGARSSRIYGFEKKLHNKFECKYTVGDSSKYSRIAALEKNVKAIEYTEKAYIGSSTGAYLITQYDTTPPSDFNAFSALRAKLEHVSKKYSDTVQGLLSFTKGMKSANYAPGFFGQGFSIQPMRDALGNILPSWEGVFEYLTVTKKATFKEIIIEQLSHVGGALLLSPAAIKCTAVENILDTDGVTVKAYRCFFDNSEVPNRFDLADQALCQDFSVTGSKRYWRYVIGIGEDYIDLSATDCEYGSDIPEPEDAIIQLGNRADPARQAAILLTSYGTGGPSFQMLTNVGVLFEGETTPYTLENREEIRIKPNDSLFTGTVVIAGTDGKKYRVPRDRGEWTPGTIALYYDRYSYNGSLWLCLAVPSTDLEPNEQNETAWLKQVAKGSDGSAGNYTSYVFKESDTQPAAPTGTSPVPAGWLDAPTGVGNWWMSMATVNAVNNQAGEWSTPIQVTGEDGSVFPYRYAKNTSKTEYPAIVRTDVEPAGWSTTPPALQPGEYLWMTQAEIRFKTVTSTGNVFDITFDDTFYTEATEGTTTKTATLLSNWTEPVRISGENGQDGLDGKSIEFIFTRTTTQVTPDTPVSVNEDDYVPTNWTDDQTGVDNLYQFEYASKRVRSITGVWGDFSVPALWAKYSFDGQDGKDGKDYEFIYIRTTTDTAPQTPETSQVDDFVPAGWTDDPVGVDSTWIYQWVSKRTKVNGVWGAFSAPAKWSNFAFDGTPGTPGTNGLPAILAALTNDYHIVPAQHDGTGQDYTGATTTLKLYVGGVEKITDVTYAFTGDVGVGFTVNGNTITITSLTVASATITCRATYAGVNYDRIFKVVMLKRAADGTNGVDGVDGATLYTWVKYADDASGTGLSDNPAGKSYIGLAYNKTTATEGTNPADYTWSLIKGADGINGTDGTDGINGVSYYTWIKYADNASGSGISDSPTGKAYIGLAHNKTTAVESTNPADYTWSLIKGADGVPGTNGVDGTTFYTWIKYSDYADGTSLYDTPSANTLYIGIATNKTTAVESTVKTDYTWSKFKGDTGVAGPSLYTWIKYSDYADGTSLYDTPSASTLYIGIAVNKTSATESTNKADYVWSKFKGDAGVAGADGVRYWVINGQSVIVKNGTTFTPSTLWFYPRKQVGAAAPVAAAGCSFKIIGFKPGDSTEYVVLGPTTISSEMSFSLTVTSTYVSYKAQLILSSVVLDEQRIYMTEDAKSAQDNISAAIGYADFNDFLAHAAQTHIVQGNGKISSALIESEVIITDAVMAKKIAELAGARITQEVATFTQKNGVAIQSTIGGNETSVTIRPDSLQDKASFLASVSLSGQTNLPALSDNAWNPSVVKTNVATSYQTIPTGVNAVKWNSIPLVASISVNSRNAADLERGVGLTISLYARFQQDSTLLTETLLGTVSGSSSTDSYSLSASVAAGQAAVPGGANRVYLVARYFASGNFNMAFPIPTCTMSFTAKSLASYFTNGTGIRKTQISPDGIAVALDANNYLHVKAGTTKMLLSYMGDIESNSIAQKLLTMSIAASGLIVNVGGYMKKAGFTVGSSVTKVSTGVWRIQHDIYSNYGLGPSSYTVHPVAANAGYDIPAYMYISASDTTSYNWTEVRAMNHQGVLVDTEFYLTFMRI